MTRCVIWFKLAPTGDASRVSLGLVLRDGLFEAVAGDQLEHLAEDAAYSFQGEVSLANLISFLQELISSYQRGFTILSANLDTSGFKP